MKFHLLVLFFVIILCAKSEKIDFEFCKDAPGLKIESIDISETKPKAGDTVTIITEGRILNQTIFLSYGYVFVEIFLGPARLKTFRYMVCGNVQPECPLNYESGNIVLSLAQEIPSIVLPATYTIKVSAYDQKDRIQSCVDFPLKVVL